MTDLATLGLRVDSRDLNRANNDLRGFERQAGKTGNAATTLTGSIKRMAIGFGAVAAAVTLANKAFDATQTYTKITNSLKAMGASGEEAAIRLERIADIANRTRAPLESTASLYQRLSIAQTELGATSAQVEKFVESVGYALGASGSSASEASGALTQLSQAMAGGVVRAEEFNSILENAYPIALAAARGIDEAGGSVGRLRNLVVDGKISSQEFFAAILEQSDALRASFENTDATVGQALTLISNNFTMLVGSIDASVRGMTTFAETLVLIGDNLGRVLAYGVTAATVFGGRYVAGIVAARLATLSLSGALVALRTALIRTGIGALIVGAGELVYQFTRLTSAGVSFGDAMGLLGDVAAAVFMGIIDSAAAIPPALNGVWDLMRAGFLKSLSSMAGAMSRFILKISAGFAAVPGLEGFSESLTDAGVSAGEAANDIWEAANTARAAAGGGLSEAAGIIAGAFGPAREAIAALNAASVVTPGALEEVAGSALAAAAALGDGKGGKKGGKKGLSDAAKAAKKEMAGAAKTAKDLADEIQRLEFDADPLKKYNHEIKELDKLVKGGLSSGAYEHAVEKLNEELANGVPMVNDLANAFGDWVSSGFQDFKGFVDSILTSFKSMISEMVATAVRNPIMIALGFGGSGGIAGQATGSAAGMLKGLLGSIDKPAGGGILGGLGGVLTGITSGFSTGGLGGALSGGFAASMSGISAGLGMGGFAGITAAIGAAAPILLAVVGVVSLFKSKKTLLDSGLEGVYDGMEFIGYTFEKIQKSRFWGLSKSTRTNRSALDQDTSDEIFSGFDTLRRSVLDMANALNVGAGALDGFTFAFKVSTAGKSDDEIQKLLEAEFQRAGSAMAELALGTSAYTREGEEAIATLERLSTSLSASNVILRDLGLTLFDVSVAGGDAASSFVDLFGSIEDFVRVTDVYYKNFYTTQEKLTNATRALEDAFGDLYIETIPQTRAQFRALVELMDAMGDTEAVAGLLSLVELFEQVEALEIDVYVTALAQAQTAADQALRGLEQAYAAAKGAIEGERDAIIGKWDDLLDAMKARLDDAEKAADTALGYASTIFGARKDEIRTALGAINDTFGELIDSARDRAGSLTSIISDLNGALASRAPMSRAAALDVIRTGDLSDPAAISNALGVLADNSDREFNSAADMQLAQARATAAIVNLRDKAAGQLSVEEQALAALESQLSAETKALEAQITYFDAQLEAMEQQLAALTGVDRTLQGAVAAIYGTGTQVSDIVASSADISAGVITRALVAGNMDLRTVVAQAGNLTQGEIAMLIARVGAGDASAQSELQRIVTTLLTTTGTVSTHIDAVATAQHAASQAVIASLLAGDTRLTAAIGGAAGLTNARLADLLSGVAAGDVVAAQHLTSIVNAVLSSGTAVQGRLAQLMGVSTATTDQVIAALQQGNSAVSGVIAQAAGLTNAEIARLLSMTATGDAQAVQTLQSIVNATLSQTGDITALLGTVTTAQYASTQAIIASLMQGNAQISAAVGQAAGITQGDLSVLLAQVAAGDQAATEHLQSLINALVSGDQTVTGEIAGQNQLTSYVLEAIGALATLRDQESLLRNQSVAEIEAAQQAADDQIEALDAMVAGILTLDGSLASVETAITHMTVALSSYLDNQGALDAAKAALDAALAREAAAAGATDQAAAEREASEARRNAEKAAALNAELQRLVSKGAFSAVAPLTVASTGVQGGLQGYGGSGEAMAYTLSDGQVFYSGMDNFGSGSTEPAAVTKAIADSKAYARYIEDLTAQGNLLRSKITDLGAIPGFADGGLHGGGLRLVGERGPEIEATGKARYFNARQTQQMMGGDPQAAAESRALRLEFAAMREEQRQLGLAIANNTKKSSDKLNKFDRDGLPKERV